MTDDVSRAVCPECAAPLTGEEVICPVCLARLPALANDIVIPKSVKLSPPGNQTVTAPNLHMSASEQLRLRLQFFPWHKLLIAVAIGLAILSMLATAASGLWLLTRNTSPELPLEQQLAGADRLYQQKNYADAVTAYQAVLAAHPASAAAFSGLGWSYFHLTRDQEAFAAFSAATELNPGLVEAQLGLGQSAYYLNKNAEAVTALRRVIKLNPEKTRAYAYLGATYFRQKMYTEAIEPLQAAAWRDPTDAESLAMLGKSLLLLNRPAEAVMPLERAAELTPNDNSLHQYLARAYNQLGDYDEAIKHARMALKSSPNDLQLATVLGQALYNYGDPDGAAKAMSEVVAGNPDTPLLSSIYQVLGQVYFQRGEYLTATHLLHTATALDGTSAQALADLGRSYLALDRREEGCAFLQQALEQQPELPGLEAELARCGLAHTPSP
ncbi:MAG: hypothetical protein Kow0031_27020 [Anaerolineae bacterium]